MQRLRTSRLDSATSRSVINVTALESKRVVIVGCGAIGGGVARLFAKTGVGRLDLVDRELLGWENIRRHELGGRSVGLFKVDALASDLRKDFPEIVKVRSYPKTIQDLVVSGNNILDGADLIVATTGSLHADSYIDELARQSEQPIPVVIGWMEAWGVAGHALLLSGNGTRFIDGFDDGMPLRPSSQNDRPAPKECGNGTTPFGATEVAAVQATIVELSVDRLLDPDMADVWRTWWTSDRNLTRVQGQWTNDFVAVKPAGTLSGVLERQWP
jgi:molybdopterin/thiamine biosynthesis adenylyltransferase